MDSIDGEEQMNVVYVGEFSEVDVKFRGMDRAYRFQRDVPRAVPRSMHLLFEGHGQFIVGDRLTEMQQSRAGPVTTIMVRRLGALGDVLALHGALMGLHAAAPGAYRFILQTSPTYVDAMRLQPGYVEVVDHVSPIVLRTSVDRYWNLDSWYELDHRPEGPKDSRVERTWYRLLGKQRVDLPDLRADFSFIVPEAARQKIWTLFREARLDRETRKKLLIGVACSARSTTARTPNQDLVRAACAALVARGAEIMFVENDPPPWASCSKDGPYHHIRTNIPEAVEVMRQLDAVITPDSGSMWLAHCGPTPLVFWGGSTPGTVKCAHHPFWPRGVRLIQTNDWINCPACYEHAEACGHAYTCLKSPDPERFVRETVDGAWYLAEEHRRGAFKETSLPV